MKVIDKNASYILPRNITDYASVVLIDDGCVEGQIESLEVTLANVVRALSILIDLMACAGIVKANDLEEMLPEAVPADLEFVEEDLHEQNAG